MNLEIALALESKSAIVSARNLADRRDRFVEANLHRTYLQIHRIVGSVAAARELTEQALIKALGRGEQLTDERKAAVWLCRIARDTAMDFVRRNNGVPVTSANCAFDEPLSRLTPGERAALVLRDAEGLPAGQVAKQLGCSKATVRTHLSNARIKFRLYLERRRQSNLKSLAR